MNNEIVRFLFIDSGTSPDLSHKEKLRKSLSGITARQEEKWFSYEDTLDEEELKAVFDYINVCDIVGLMISDDFVYEIQQQNSLLNRLIAEIRKRHDEEGIYLIPIIIRENYGWHNIPLLAELEPLPRNGTPISGRGKNQDSMRATIAQAIEPLIIERVDYKKKLKEYEDSAFIIFQESPKSNERNKQLKDVQEQLGIYEKDKIRIKKIVKQELEARAERYKSQFKEALSQAYPMPENIVDDFKRLKEELGFIDEYVDSLEHQVISEFQQQQVEHQQEQKRQQYIFQENQQNSTEDFGLIPVGVIALVALIVFGSLVGSPQLQTQPNNFQTQPNNSTPNQLQPSQPDGWIWLGAIYGNSNRILVNQTLEIDAYINPPRIPYRGAEVIAVRDIALRIEAGTNNQQVGLVRADEKIKIVRIYSLINQNYNPPITEIWAEIRRP